MPAPQSQIDLLKKYPRPIAHLRAQLKRHRLGLLFGAGASKDIGFPNWKELVDRVAAHPDVQGIEHLEKFRSESSPAVSLTRSLASVTQMLFAFYRRKQITLSKLAEPLAFFQEQKIKSSWLRLIHEELYRDLPSEIQMQKIADHPFLRSFLDVIKRSPITVNYNFDDTLELMLLDARNVVEREKTRGYEVAYRPNSQFQRDTSVIYHPNGFLPSKFDDGTSAEVIFSDEAFQDQLLSAATGKYLHLSNHLFRNTCLLIGLSLEDPTLQSMLRQNTLGSPGNVHYIVHYLGEADGADKDALETVSQQNFSSYGLFTLFLDKVGIRDLAELIAMDDGVFGINFERYVPKYVYYIIGSVGSGKSTAAANLRNLITYDEWIDPRPPGLAKAEEEVDPEEVARLNEWIAEQFRKKNYALQAAHEGIHVIDRAPLDPLTFGPKAEIKAKATKLISKITDDGTRRICQGHIIHLDCDLEEVRIRNSLKHKYWTDDQFTDLLNRIPEIYGSFDRTVICTRGRDATAVAREIAKVIFLGDYKPVDLESSLRELGQADAN